MQYLETSYLTNATVSCQRLSLDDKEERKIRETYQKCLQKNRSNSNKQKLFTISTLNCINSKLNLVELPVYWVIY